MHPISTLAAVGRTRIWSAVKLPVFTRLAVVRRTSSKSYSKSTLFQQARSIAGSPNKMARGKMSRGGGGNMGRTEQVSRALSRTLRHSAHDENLNMREDGYVNVEELLNSRKYKQLKLDFETLCQVVAENSKKRFKLIREEPAGAGTLPLLSDVSVSTSTDPSISTNPRVTTSKTEEFIPDFDNDPNPDLTQFWIRAVQGHSIAVEESLLLTPIDEAKLPPMCVHGTYFAALTQILESGGLNKMGRTHIHCASGLPKASVHPETGEDIPAVLSGMRFNAEVLFYIDIQKGVQEGVKFWKSDNNVILTNGKEQDGHLSLDYVIRVEDVCGRAGGGDLWTRDEGVIKDWPRGGKTKKDRSKQGGGRGGRGKGKGRLNAAIENDLVEVSNSLGDTKI